MCVCKACRPLTDLDDLVDAGLGVDVDVADALAVPEHGDALSGALDVPHQLGGAARDDQVNHLLQTTQVLHILTRAHLGETRDKTQTQTQDILLTLPYFR